MKLCRGFIIFLVYIADVISLLDFTWVQSVHPWWKAFKNWRAQFWKIEEIYAKKVIKSKY